MKTRHYGSLVLTRIASATQIAFWGLCLGLFLTGDVKIAAQNCDDLNDTWEKQCQGANARNVCGSPLKKCIMKVSELNGTATATQPGQTSSIICVYSKTKVEWDEEYAQNAKFVVTFSNSHTPFANDESIFFGTSLQSDTGVIDDNANLCYKYSVLHQINGEPSTTADPKVIVNGAKHKPPTP